MPEIIDQVKDTALLVLGALGCFVVSFLAFVLYGDYIKRRR